MMLLYVVEIEIVDLIDDDVDEFRVWMTNNNTTMHKNFNTDVINKWWIGLIRHRYYYYYYWLSYLLLLPFFFSASLFFSKRSLSSPSLISASIISRDLYEPPLQDIVDPNFQISL